MNQKDIRELMRLFDKSGLNEMKIKDGDFSISFQKGGSYASFPVAESQIVSTPVHAPAAAVAIATEEKQKEIAGDHITSPMVGTFYKSPSPDSPAFVKVGDKISKGQTLGIIEAMKIMNELEAEFDCKILDILVSDGQPIEYDMPLFVVEKV